MIDDGLFMHHPAKNYVFISAALADCCFARCPLSHRLSMIICTVLLAITCIGFVACGNDNGGGEIQKPLHDSTKWFTEEELSAKGLAGLTAPTGLSGEMNSSDAWYNDGYSFSQVCPDEETFKTNAETYFSYLKTHYDGVFLSLIHI